MAAAGSGGASWRTLRTWDRAGRAGRVVARSYLTRPAAPATPPPARCGPADLQNLDLSFIRTYRPMLDDGPGRALHTMADYRKWGDENLHPVAGFSPEAGRPGSVRPGGEAPRLDELSHANEQPPRSGRRRGCRWRCHRHLRPDSTGVLASARGCPCSTTAESPTCSTATARTRGTRPIMGYMITTGPARHSGCGKRRFSRSEPAVGMGPEAGLP